MAITVTALAEEVAVEFGEHFEDSATATQFKDWVREVYQEIVTAGRWRFLNQEDSLSLVSGTATYTLGVDVAEVILIYNPNVITGTYTGVYSYMPVERVIARLPDSGLPDDFTVWYYEERDTASGALKISFEPAPTVNHSVTLRVLLLPSVLGDTTNIPLPEDFIRVIRLGIRSRVHKADGHIDEYQAVRKEFAEALGLLVSRFTSPQAPGSQLAVKGVRAVRQSPVSANN